jgi:hypothetical protein
MKKAYQKGSVVGNSKPKPPSKKQPIVYSFKTIYTQKQAEKKTTLPTFTTHSKSKNWN